ncbi:uncharacterized protein LOC110606263 [Manihot esculenta]|uniref:Methyltransferase-related protein n=1 Tax=Manihot esculenta TaxID=3983 RepID=A0A2C9U344_MANES|nr:uncharacterized protein LOC110606263 [Manihot esculenta]OAY24139.1 hypothetical protein MANES_18G137400v8 [Manihot esculenta]
MCPLRLILIFLSATLAGFFVVRNFKSRPFTADDNDSDESSSTERPFPSKVRSAIESGFWTCVDMASGRYLWRHLVSSPSSSSSSPPKHSN